MSRPENFFIPNYTPETLSESDQDNLTPFFASHRAITEYAQKIKEVGYSRLSPAQRQQLDQCLQLYNIIGTLGDFSQKMILADQILRQRLQDSSLSVEEEMKITEAVTFLNVLLAAAMIRNYKTVIIEAKKIGEVDLPHRLTHSQYVNIIRDEFYWCEKASSTSGYDFGSIIDNTRHQAAALKNTVVVLRRLITDLDEVPATIELADEQIDEQIIQVLMREIAQLTVFILRERRVPTVETDFARCIPPSLLDRSRQEKFGSQLIDQVMSVPIIIHELAVKVEKRGKSSLRDFEIDMVDQIKLLIPILKELQEYPEILQAMALHHSATLSDLFTILSKADQVDEESHTVEEHNQELYQSLMDIQVLAIESGESTDCSVLAFLGHENISFGKVEVLPAESIVPSLTELAKLCSSLKRGNYSTSVQSDAAIDCTIQKESSVKVIINLPTVSFEIYPAVNGKHKWSLIIPMDRVRGLGSSKFSQIVSELRQYVASIIEAQQTPKKIVASPEPVAKMPKRVPPDASEEKKKPKKPIEPNKNGGKVTNGNSQELEIQKEKSEIKIVVIDPERKFRQFIDNNPGLPTIEKLGFELENVQFGQLEKLDRYGKDTLVRKHLTRKIIAIYEISKSPKGEMILKVVDVRYRKDGYKL